MHITIIAVGTRGDVQPYIALGKGLLDAGHAVRLATHLEFERLVREQNLDFFLLRGSPSVLMQNSDFMAAFEKGLNPLVWIRGLVKSLESMFEDGITDVWNACQGTDAAVFSVMGFYAGYHVAEKLGIPFFQTLVFPAYPTRAFSSPLLPFNLHLGGTVNWLTHVALVQAFWQVFRRVINKSRRSVLDMPPLPFFGLSRQLERQQQPTLHGYSPLMLPKSPDWGNWHHVTGYWFLDSPSVWQPPADLVDFLGADPPPVYVGFGSMVNKDVEQVTAAVLEALQRSGQRGLLLTGWGGINASDLPDDVFVIDSVPHDWLFPRMTAVVHHGGSGTTAAGMRAGVPSIIVPFAGDQLFWGWRINQLGIGPLPIPRKQLSAERLAQAIREAVNDEAMRQRARDFGEKIRAENGVGRAVTVVEQTLNPA